jgi:UDP-N-acetylmuramoylalanine--D-glutamate ligase
VAIRAFTEPKVVILGGASKGTAFDKLAKAVIEGNVRHVITIGDTGPIISDELQAGGFTEVSPGGTTMQEMVEAARSHAQDGDVVLLSTGCASFGLFHDYKDRGNQFKQVVTAL